MTKEEILNMDGEELKVQVAEKIFGWKELHYEKQEVGGWPPTFHPGGWYGHGPNNECYMCNEYPTDISVAWKIVEKLKYPKGKYLFTIESLPGYNDKTNSEWQALFVTGKGKEYIAEGETAPLAICRAALLAVMENK